MTVSFQKKVIHQYDDGSFYRSYFVNVGEDRKVSFDMFTESKQKGKYFCSDWDTCKNSGEWYIAKNTTEAKKWFTERLLNYKLS